MARVLVTLAGTGASDRAHVVRERHLAMLAGAGLVPVLLPGTLSEPAAAELAACCVCAYLPGTDYVPTRLEEGESESRRSAESLGLPWDPWKVRADLLALELAWARRLPLLGVCGGMQAMVIRAGGALGPAPAGAHDARVQAEPVQLVPGSLAARVLGAAPRANSLHRQAAVAVPDPLRVSARALDGTVEAVEAPAAEHPFWLGLQWHPELLGDGAPYRALAAAASVPA